MRSLLASYFKKPPIAFKKLITVALIISVFFLLKAYTNHLINEYNFAFSWFLTAMKLGITYFLWVILTPLVYTLTKRLQNKQIPILIKVFQFLIGSILLAFLHQSLSLWLDNLINYSNSGYLKSFFGHNNVVVLIIGSFSSFIELLVIVAVFLASDYQQRYLQNQKALIEAQLNALRMQLQPHFLFNTLHSIASMIDIDTKNAQKMLTKLGNLLRRMLEYNDTQMVRVEDELDFIKNYLDLEQVRYQDRVTINYSIDKEALNLKIPNMIFQPLVENAVKYGIIPTVDHGKITISIQREHDDTLNTEALILQISNTYNDQSTFHKPVSTGVGLVNIKERLQKIYQSNYVFNSDFVTAELYNAKITLPILK